MLIKCSECGQDVSSEAENCIHCGYPIKEYFEKLCINSSVEMAAFQAEVNWLIKKVKPTDFACPPPRAKVCAKCGMYIDPVSEAPQCRCSKDENGKIYPNIEVDYPAAGIGYNNGAILYIYEHCVKPQNIGDENSIEYKTEVENLYKSIEDFKTAGSYITEIPPNPKCYGVSTTRETELSAMNEAINAQKTPQINHNHAEPHCPSCSSTNLTKITIAKKGLKVALFGIFGTVDNGKTWKCNNCGTKF